MIKHSHHDGKYLKYALKYRAMKKWFKQNFKIEYSVESQTNWVMFSIFTSDWKEKTKRETFKSQQWYDKYHY